MERSEGYRSSVTELVTDAQAVLDVVSALPPSAAAQEAVGLLALVAGQDVEPGDGEGTWRIAQHTRYDRIVSVHDPESRHVCKTVHSYWDGFKAHIAVEPETGVVTACDLTAGNVGDSQAAPNLLEGEPAGIQVLGDSAYGAGAFRDHLATCKQEAVIKPGPLRSAIEGGFTIDEFAIDLDMRTVTCPAGITVPIRLGGVALFRQRCSDCPLRQRCTMSLRGREVKVHPHHARLHAARRQAETPEFQQVYRQFRPMVERSIAWIVRKGHRRVAYRGVDRNRIWLGHRIAAVNLTALLNLGLHQGPDECAVG